MRQLKEETDIELPHWENPKIENTYKSYQYEDNRNINTPPENKPLRNKRFSKEDCNFTDFD